MNTADLKEAIGATNAILNALLATLHGSTGLPGAQLRFVCGQLATNGADELDASDQTQFWANFSNCFEQARLAGATFAAIEAVRGLAEAQTPVSLAAITVKNFAVRLALAEQAQILAATTFVSRQDIDNYFDQINVSFDTAITVAADALDNVAYVALTALFAAVSNDLANRARPLPRMVTYTFPTRMPSLWMAQRLYYDPSRNDELIAENKPVHPLFMGSTGVALSA
jgi:prophage DNA circulation protein